MPEPAGGRFPWPVFPCDILTMSPEFAEDTALRRAIQRLYGEALYNSAWLTLEYVRDVFDRAYEQETHSLKPFVQRNLDNGFGLSQRVSGGEAESVQSIEANKRRDDASRGQ